GVNRPLKRMKEQMLFSTVMGACFTHCLSRLLKEPAQKLLSTMDLTGTIVQIL
ncbi:hypothetical protein IRJ41_019201, partial [Triplophysa rosa]